MVRFISVPVTTSFAVKKEAKDNPQNTQTSAVQSVGSRLTWAATRLIKYVFFSCTGRHLYDADQTCIDYSRIKGNDLTSWITVEKLLVWSYSRNSPNFVVPEGSLECSSPPLVSMLSQTHPAQALPSHFFNTFLILYYQVPKVFQVLYFLQFSPWKIYAILFCQCVPHTLPISSSWMQSSSLLLLPVS